jgi:hypothetical protein
MVIGVPAGIVVGVRELVGEIPPLSDAASKGKCWSAAFSSIPGRLSRREQPARISPIKRTVNTAAFRQFPFDNFIKQSCRARPLSDKSQAGCHRPRPIYQRVKGSAGDRDVFITGIIAPAWECHGSVIRPGAPR